MKGSQTDPYTYRPIALLSVLSKVMERSINHEHLDYLERTRQYGFRHQRSTGDLLAYVTLLCQSYDEAHVLWHAALLSKLRFYGLPEKVCRWVADFISGRKISVVIDGFSSSSHNVNAGVPQGSVLAPTLFLLHINNLLSCAINPIHSFADDSTIHAGIQSDKPISAAELEKRRLAMTSSLTRDLEGITAWGRNNLVQFNASKTHSAKEPFISAAAGKKLGYLFRAKKYFSPHDLLTLYTAQIRPSLEYCSHRRAVRLIDDSSLTDSLGILSHRRAVGDLALFYRYTNGLCSSELSSMMPSRDVPARQTRMTLASHPNRVELLTSRTGRYDRSFVPREAFPSSINLRQFKNLINKISLGSS
ncbi:unnamed protein product [Acanthoscelides obtectus]|uniref:Reverse transcriptase domain-containing protein n=1 Tax=Acanthoscelides obtectus TaxID=200917 RepID=A0A9P0JSX7_ACAOB|nr:unnamed protein product [Acanthoscelides obtectus]CAK1633954.1 RNA-directed DNA polymerase from mobile element jockey [Acanthoscelides obtectus]